MLEFSPAELKEHLASAKHPPLLLDVREPWEYDIVHLPDSLLIPMGKIEERREELDPQRETVVICHHGIRSAKIVHVLENFGFKRVINLRGGLDAWAKEVDPKMPTYTK